MAYHSWTSDIISDWTSREGSTMWMPTSSVRPSALKASPTTSWLGSSPSSQAGPAGSSSRAPPGSSLRFPLAPHKAPLFLPCCLLFMFSPCIFPSPMVWFFHMLMILPLLLPPPRTAPTRAPSRPPLAPSGLLPTPGKSTSPFPKPN